MRTERIRRVLLPLLMLLLLAVPVHGAACEHIFTEHRIEPTCDSGGVTWLECDLCGFQQSFELIAELGHDYDEWYVIQEPDCTHEGVQARDCVRCGHRDEASIPHLGHDYVVEVVEPTCTARGYTSHYCPGCGDRFRTDYTDPLGHRYDDGVILKEPTLTAMGRILYTCIGCGDTYQDTIPKLTNPFEDIDENAYYFSAVIWAVNSGITSGIDETHFAPDRPCSRAQVVTFLWRAAGSPEPALTETPFVDIPKDAFYRKAVLWAYENGVTSGTDAIHFSPNEICIRAQVVTFLHRAKGCPAWTQGNAFPDVRKTDYFYDAVLWAAEKGITVGMDGGRFHPELTCTRGQIVTFCTAARKIPDRRHIMTQRDLLHTGAIYFPNDPSIMEDQLQYLDKLCDFNQTRPTEQSKREAMLREMFAEIGEGCYIEPPLYANMGGHHVHFGKNVYANFGLTLVDDTHIYVGDHTMFGPHVTVATAGHPIEPSLREQGLQYNMPVRIGKNCWIGAGAIILPGVTIGDNVVIGAGSVVTKDLPSNVVAVGNPCRILREVGEHDRVYYYKDRRIDYESL